MAFEGLKKGLRAATEVARSARSPMELAKLALPDAMRARHMLNEGPLPEGAPEGAEVAHAMRALRNRLKGQAYVADGGVDYARLADSEVYAELAELSRALRRVEPEDLDGQAERLAFWINLYNVQMIHGVIALGITDSIREVPTFFQTVTYRVGEHLFTPDDIEHGLLRRNAAHPMTGKRRFEEQDPRMAWAPPELDARVHMALVCVAQSCPPIAFYDPEHLDAQLELASLNFVNGATTVDHQARVIQASAIFSWYGHDFGDEAALHRFLVDHADPPLRQDIERAIERGYAWAWRDYDWSLNAL